MVGQTINHFKILSKLGEGGMGVVYKAEDTKLERTVAIKFLPREVAVQEEAKERFKIEAKAAAALNHPNIATIHQIEEVGENTFIVMEFVEGQNLRQLLQAQGVISMDDVINFAIQIAEGLQAAHQKGIIHRDIKSANIMITENGQVKIMDFGLAKLPSEMQFTKTGTTIGTIAYLSPEQAHDGVAIDHRTDIWSFGVVLYEILAGQLPFRGGHEMAIMYAIMNKAPEPIPGLPESAAGKLQAVITKTLEKDKERRYQNIADLLKDLRRETKTSPEIITAKTLKKTNIPKRAIVLTAIVALVGVLATFILLSTLQNQRQRSVPLSVRALTTFEAFEAFPSWSPDGSQIVFGDTRYGSVDIFVMSLGGGEPRRITETPYDEVNSRWSRDGTKIAFLSDRGNGTTIYWIPPTGGAERKITETHLPYFERWDPAVHALGAMPWSPDSKELVFSRIQPTGEIALWIVNLETAGEKQITYPPKGAEDLNPCWSWNGKWIAFNREAGGNCHLIVQRVDGAETRILVKGEHHYHAPSWSPNDDKIAMFSNRSGTFNIWEIDIDSGDPYQLTTGAGMDSKPVYSQKGDIVYTLANHKVNLYLGGVNAPASEHRQLTSGTLDDFFPRLSPDGKKAVFQSSRTGNDEIWLLDLESGSQLQLTNHPAMDRIPDWSPDGGTIVFASNRLGLFQLWAMSADGGTARNLSKQEIPVPALGHSSMNASPRWSPDGTDIGYLVAGEKGPTLWLIDADGKNPRPTQLSGILGFDWYRDSRYVVYNSKSKDGSGSVEMRLADLETGEENVLFKGFASEVTVAPNGNAISFCQSASHFNQSLAVLHLTEFSQEGVLPRPLGEPQPLVEGHGIWHIHNGGWSKDGSQIIYSRDTDRGDIYAILNANELVGYGR